jgi:hypothetical protein
MTEIEEAEPRMVEIFTTERGREVWRIALTAGRYTDSLRMTEAEARLVYRALGERLAPTDAKTWDRVHNRPADIFTPPEDRVAPPTGAEREALAPIRALVAVLASRLHHVETHWTPDERSAPASTAHVLREFDRLAAGLRQQDPTAEEWEYGVVGPTGRMVNNGDYTHLQTHRRRKVGPWEPVEAARDAS